MKTFPASEGLLSRIPSSDPSTKSTVATDASAPIESDKAAKSSLPPGYDTVPNLLQKIEESKTSMTGAESVEDPKQSNPAEKIQPKAVAERDALKDMTPSQRAATKAPRVTSLNSGGDGPMQKAPTKEKSASAKVEKTSASTLTPISKAKSAPETPSLTDIMNSTDDNDSVQESTVDSKELRGGTSGKEKLARLLGKGDFQTDKVDGPDVVDDSVYRKPQAGKSAGRPGRGKPGWKRGGGRKPAPWKTGDGAKLTQEDPALGEVKALRSELESQMKWEAVRLQEAIRAQMVEDSKIAAKEAAAVTKKHEEELAHVREDAIAKAERMLKEKSVELKTNADAQRDSDLTRLLTVKEEEMREALTTEYADKERTETIEREKALVTAKSQVTALSEQFDTVVAQTEKAKEAAKRASFAFMLRESVSTNRPIGKQLSEAADRTELGKLVAESVPTSAIRGGVSSIDVLKEDFRHASKRGLSVAMVPEGKTGTIWGHFLGAIFSRLKIPIDSWDDEPTMSLSNNEERLRRAERLLADGDLGSAIITLEALSGLAADIMKDWVSAAKARVAADLAAEVLLADAIIMQVSLTHGRDIIEKPVSC